MRTSLLLVVLAAPLASGCGHSCNLMYAPSTTNIVFDAPDGWPADTYVIELQGYTKEAMCVVTLPVVEDTDVHCTVNLALTLSESGDAILQASATEFAPDGFRATVFGDSGQIEATADFTPEYEVDEPNGQGCGERRVVTLDMTIE